MIFHAGDWAVPVAVSIPHAGLILPAGTAPLLADPSRSVRRIADLAVNRLAGPLRDLGAAALASRMSRLWCDVERWPDGREEMNRVGMGVVYDVDADLNPLRLGSLPDGERERRFDLLYRPYHARLADMCRWRCERLGRCLLIDLHSYATRPLPYELHADEPRPQVCLGHNGDRAGHAAADLFAARLADAGLTVGVNTTFHGAIRPETLSERRYPTLAPLMVEIRRDVYLDRGDTDDPRIRPADAARLARLLAETAGEWMNRTNQGDPS